MKMAKFLKKQILQRKIFLIIFSLFLASPLFAQTCPQSIVVYSAGGHDFDGWKLINGQSTHSLIGLDIVSGELKSDPSDNALQRPLEKEDGSVIWKFSKRPANQEIWMICNYISTTSRLVRRIESDITECGVIRKKTGIRGEVAPVQALCRK